jgi:hypothetical protein
MIGSISDVAHQAKKAYPQTFEVKGSFIDAYAEHGGMGVSLMFELPMGLGKGRMSRGFTLANYQRYDSVETRLSIAKEAYRTLRRMTEQKDLGPEAMPDFNVLAWVNRVCDELCR